MRGVRHRVPRPHLRTRTCALSVAALALGLPAIAHAHAGAPPEPHDIWTAWSLEPVVILALAAGAFAYARGVRALRRRAGGSRGLASWRVRCHAAGLATLAIALVSPVDPLGESLFAGHMVQHLLLTMVAAPLLVMGDPGTTMLRALPDAPRHRAARAWRRAHRLRSILRALADPITAWSLHLVALVAWHVPVLYETAVRDDAVHALEHASFLLTAILFWWPIAAPRARWRLGIGPALLYLFTATVASTLLGALMALARSPWYLVHARTAYAWGLTPLEDQQLAGLIMWVPAGLVYVGAAMVVAAGVLSGTRGAVRG